MCYINISCFWHHYYYFCKSQGCGKFGQERVLQTEDGIKTDLRVKCPSPGWVAQLVGASSSTPKSRRFNPSSGYIPRMWVQFLVRVCMRSNWSIFLSHIHVSLSLSFSFPLPRSSLCKIYKNIFLDEDKKRKKELNVQASKRRVSKAHGAKQEYHVRAGGSVISLLQSQGSLI